MEETRVTLDDMNDDELDEAPKMTTSRRQMAAQAMAGRRQTSLDTGRPPSSDRSTIRYRYSGSVSECWRRCRAAYTAASVRRVTCILLSTLVT
jgi:hypothetical protein